MSKIELLAAPPPQRTGHLKRRDKCPCRNSRVSNTSGLFAFLFFLVLSLLPSTFFEPRAAPASSTVG